MAMQRFHVSLKKKNNSILFSSDVRLKAIKNLNLKLIEVKLNE